MSFVHVLATDDSQAAARAGSALSMFLGLALLLGLFVAGITLIMIARRIRQRQRTEARASSTTGPDPWRASAQRIQPYPRHEEHEG